MKCEEIRERMPDVAAGFGEFTAEESRHLASCTGCAEQLKAMRATMSLLDEWQVRSHRHILMYACKPVCVKKWQSRRRDGCTGSAARFWLRLLQ